MIRLAEVFRDEKILSTLSKELGWSHFVEIIPLEDDLKRDFYAEMCQVERWSVRTLRQKIGTMLFERTALSKKPEKLIRGELDDLRAQDKLTPDLVFRDPYFLEFLGLKDRYLEKDIEDAIMREMEHFILELGVGFTFVARQKHIQVDSDDYYPDLLFYHRGLRRLVAIDLKLRDFQPSDKGQMELYLRWLAKYEQQPARNRRSVWFCALVRSRKPWSCWNLKRAVSGWRRTGRRYCQRDCFSANCTKRCSMRVRGWRRRAPAISRNNLTRGLHPNEHSG